MLPELEKARIRMICILQMRKQKLREVEGLARGFSAKRTAGTKI